MRWSHWLALALTCLGVSAAGDGAAEETEEPKASFLHPDFDPSEAKEALNGVRIEQCRKKDGPTGRGHVLIEFQPSGRVSNAVVDQAPFSGTKVGTCIAKAFMGARVQPFVGDPVRVGKAFTL